MNDYIRFDRLSDANASLDEFCFCIERLTIDDDKAAWKYAIISIHNALQGYICKGLHFSQRSKSEGSKERPGHREWSEAYEKGDLLPLPRQDIFENLYDKFYGKNNSKLDWERIKWLHDQRNNFVHFNVDGFSLPANEVILCCTEALEAIKQASQYTKELFFYEESQKQSYQESCERAERLLHKLRKNLKQLESI